MNKYVYTAKDYLNNKKKGIIYSESDDDFKKIINNQQLFLIKYKIKKNKEYNISLLKIVSNSELIAFTRQMGMMLSSGFNIIDSLNLVINNVKNNYFKDILNNVKLNILNGESFSNTIKQYKNIFPEVYYNMVTLGEMTCKLDEVMLTLAEYLEKNYKLKKKIKSVMIYPTFLSVMIVIVTLILSLFVIPNFESILKENSIELPFITKLVLMFSSFLQKYLWIVIAIIVILILLFKLIKHKKIIRTFIDKLKINLFIVKDFNKLIITNRFITTLYILLKNNLNIIKSMDLLSNMLGNVVINEKTKICVQEIKKGRSISNALLIIGYYPDMLIEMLKIGENSGRLVNILEIASNYYEDQLNYKIKTFSTFIEPMMILILAGIVCILLLAVFLPMLSIFDSINGGVM